MAEPIKGPWPGAELGEASPAYNRQTAPSERWEANACSNCRHFRPMAEVYIAGERIDNYCIWHHGRIPETKICRQWQKGLYASEIKEQIEAQWERPGVINNLHINCATQAEKIEKQGDLFVIRRGRRVQDDGHEKKLREYLAGIRRGEKS